MTKHIARSLAGVLIGVIVGTAAGVGLGFAAQAQAAYDKALKRPDLPGRTMTVPRRPCADLQDFNWCYWDAERNDFLRNQDGSIALNDQGEPVVTSTHSYWAYSTPGPQEGTQRVCITYLNWRYNKTYGGCALQTVN